MKSEFHAGKMRRNLKLDKCLEKMKHEIEENSLRKIFIRINREKEGNREYRFLSME